ncbi:hypothetical protein ACQPZF_35810 [Actinosynnema sp. CS-041913]|uniref:hypothetical protein n=1 Tax=Actinosynnema sp. CS-041913 TaxID=3239917 RepID=UPI003D8F8E9C
MQRQILRTAHVLLVGAVLGLLGGNVYRRKRRLAGSRHASQRFGSKQVMWDERDWRAYWWHEQRLLARKEAEDFLNGLLTVLTLGVYRAENLWCCDSAIPKRPLRAFWPRRVWTWWNRVRR